MNATDSDIKMILGAYKKYCVYGLSPDSQKPSRGVPLYMKREGFDAVGVYPKPVVDNEFRIFQKLSEVPIEYRQFVNVFRRSENIPELVDEVLSLGGTKVLWLQLGISHPEAERKAEQAELLVVSNKCLKIEFDRWIK